MASKFSIQTVFKAIDKITGPMAKIGRESQKLGKRMEEAMKGPNKFADRSIKVMKRLTLAAGAAAAGAGLAARNFIQTGASFEEAISAVGAVGLQTREQIRDLEERAMQLGATTKFTATEAANAMEIMARAGFTNQEILAGVDGVLSAAAASGLEMAEVADHVSNVLKGMGLEAGEAGRVADVLTLASSRTNSSIGSLGESMKNLSPVARQFGISLEEAVGMVALLQDVGLDASEAGTATATMLTKLAKPTTAVMKEMKRLGITFQDAEGNMLPPLEIFEQMMTATDKLGGNMDQVAFFAELVGLRGQKAALNLKELFTSDKGQRLVAELRKAEGSATKMADLRMQNLIGDWTLFTSALDGFKTDVFNAIGTDLREIVTQMREWLDQNKEWLRMGIVEAFQRTKTAIKETVAAIRSFKEENPKLVQWIKDSLPLLGKLVLGWLALTAAIKVASFLLGIFNGIAAVFSFIASTIAAAKWIIGWARLMWVLAGGTAAAKVAFIGLLKVLGPILAIAATIYLVFDQFKKLLQEIGGMMGFIKGSIGGLKGAAKGFFTGKGSIMGFLDGFFQGADEHMNEEARKRAAQEQKAAEAAKKAAAGRASSSPDALTPWLPNLGGAFDLNHLQTTPLAGSGLTQIMDQLDVFEQQLNTVNTDAADKYVDSFMSGLPEIQTQFNDVSASAANVFTDTARLGLRDIQSEYAMIFGGAPAGSQMVSPGERVARAVTEHTERSEATLTINDPNRRTTLNAPKGSRVRINQQPSGSF